MQQNRNRTGFYFNKHSHISITNWKLGRVKKIIRDLHIPICMRTDLCWWLVLVCPVLLGIFWQDLTAWWGNNIDQMVLSRSILYGFVCSVTFLNLFLMSAYVSSLSCLPVLGLCTRKSLFLVFTSLTSMAVFLLFRIWKKITKKMQHEPDNELRRSQPWNEFLILLELTFRLVSETKSFFCIPEHRNHHLDHSDLPKCALPPPRTFLSPHSPIYIHKQIRINIYKKPN